MPEKYLDDSQVEEIINCSTFRYRKGCQTHEEIKILVSKFNRKITIKAVVFGGFWFERAIK
jgi:hypothetical protein